MAESEAGTKDFHTLSVNNPLMLRLELFFCPIRAVDCEEREVLLADLIAFRLRKMPYADATVGVPLTDLYFCGRYSAGP